MTGAIFNGARAACVALALTQVALAQQCYYPNGAEAPAEKPCAGAGSACCPDKWACLDNGLCYYEPSNLYGRYSCADKDWKSEGCPSNLCTYGMTAAGGEAIDQCSDHGNQWCCNGDRTHVQCCKESPEPRPFFSLGKGNQYAVVGQSSGGSPPNLATITGLVSDGEKPQSTKPPSSSSSSSSDASATKDGSSDASTTPTPTPTTSTLSSVSTGADGTKTILSTLVSTFTPPASAATDPASQTTPEKKSKVPIIVGCAVGIPVALAFVGILFWLLRKRSSQKKDKPYSGTPEPYMNGDGSPDFAGGAKFKNGHNSTYKQSAPPGVPELASQSVGPERPVSMVPGKAELGGGPGFAPGTTPMAPGLLGVGGGTGTGVPQTPQTNSSWGSAPPNYSPGQNQPTWAPGHAQTNSSGTVMPDPQQYQAYRPPQGHPANMSDVPEMAELPVNTPPAVEMGGPTPPAVAELRTDASPPAVGDMLHQRMPPR